MLHSDRGSQFTSHEYQTFLIDQQIVSSMSAVSCYDNAAAESFLGLLKRERVNQKRYLTEQKHDQIFDYIERFYNPMKLRKLNNNIQTTLNVCSRSLRL